MSKKLFIIIATILVLFLIALGAYYFILKSNSTKTGVTPTSVFRNFFPFGGTSGSVSVSTSTTTTIQPIEQPVAQLDFTQKLRHIWAQPVSGFGLFDIKAGTLIRHMDKATGHVYETSLFSPAQNRISNTTLPTAYTALWGSTNNILITQYLKDDNETVNTFSLALKTATTSQSLSSTTDQYVLSGSVMPTNIARIAVSGANVFYLTRTANASTGFVSGFDGSKKKQVWSSDITELLPQFVNDTTVTLTTTPYQNILGYMYSVNTNTGSSRKILGDIPGLSTLMSSDAKNVLYLSQNGGDTLNVYTVATQAVQNLTPVTFPEKCVWSKKNVTIIYCAVPTDTLAGGSLTDWYMGNVQYTDNIWQYDLKANTSKIVENLSADSQDVIDVASPALSTSEQYLVFQNKRDGSLWSLDLTK